MKKWLKFTLIACVSLLTVIVVALMLVSPIAKGYVNKHGKELVGRQIHVDKLRVNALAGRVRIYDMVLYEEDDTTAFFSFDTLDVSVKLRKLLFHNLHVRHITLAGPRVSIVQQGDRFNFTSIIDHFKTDDEPDDTAASDWKLGFYNIRLSNGEVLYADKVRHSRWDLNNLNIRVPGVYFDGSANTDAGIALQFANGGVLRTEASMNMDNNDFIVDVELEKFAISNIKAYLVDFMNVGKMDGVLNAKVSLKGNLSQIMKMDIGGNLSLKGIDICDDKKVPVLALNSLDLKVNRLNLDENLYDVQSVQVNGLSTHYDILANGNNFSHLFDVRQSAQPEPLQLSESDTADSTVPAVSNGGTLKLNVAHFELTDGQFTYNDFSLPDNFSFPITGIRLVSDNITSTGDNNAKLLARLPNGGGAFVNWSGDITEWKHHQHLVINIRNLQLKDLSPYSVAYLGYPFTDGTITFSSENNINFSQLNGKNTIDLYNPELGDKRKDVDAQYNLPLKAAIYILKDKDGKVQLDVPVAGNIDSPEFSYMKIVWKTLGNLLVKVATSPFRAVAKALGQSGELDFIAYNPLQVQFSAEQYSILNKIAEVLQYDTTVVVTLEPLINSTASYKEQSLYLLKEEYYMSQHPEKASTPVLPQAFLYGEVSAITTKDQGFVAFLRQKAAETPQANTLRSLKTNKPSDKEVQRLAEILYPKEASISSLEIVAEHRNAFVRRNFEQRNISERQLKIAPTQLHSDKSGYIISSQSTTDTTITNH